MEVSHFWFLRTAGGRLSGLFTRAQGALPERQVPRASLGRAAALPWLLLAVFAVPAAANDQCAEIHRKQKESAAPEFRLQGVTVTVENDLFAPGQTTDRWYTSGIHGAWSYKVAHTPQLLHGWQNFWSDVFGSARCATVSGGVGHSIYTPRRIDIAAAQPLDRPWAGFLYGGLGAYHFAEGAPGRQGYHEAVDLKLGVIGPASLAAPIQRGWHHLINSPQPQGWANQLRPALGVQISYRRTWRYQLPGDLRLHPFAGGTLGNTRTQAVAGATLHFAGAGHLVSDADEGDFATLDFNNRQNDHGNWGAYVQLQGKAVLYNRFLTGPAYGQRTEIEMQRGVATASIGLMYKVSNQLRLSYALKRRSPEFFSPNLNRRDAYQTWGGITLIWDFDVD